MVLSEFILEKISSHKFISIIGAGGKTTLLNFASYRLQKEGKKILLTTTTHLAKDVEYSCDDIVFEPVAQCDKSVLYVREDGGKYCSPPISSIISLSRHFDHVLIEADGAKNLSLKYHSSKDPVILDNNEFTFTLLGLDALDQPLEKVMHNYDLYTEEYPDRLNCKVEIIDYINLLKSSNGSHKNIDLSSCSVLLNKYDICKKNNNIELLLKEFPDVKLVSIKNNTIYHF